MLETRTKKALATVLQGVKDLAPAILRVAGLWSRLIPGAGSVIGNWLDSKGKDMLTPDRHPAMAQQGMYGLMSTDNPIIAHLEMQRRLLEGNKPQQGTSPVIPPRTPPVIPPRSSRTPSNPVDLSSIVMPVTPVSVKDTGADNIWGFSRYQQNWQKEKEGYSADEWKEIITGKKPEKGEEDKDDKKEEKKERKKQTTALERVTKAVSGLTTVMSGLEALGIELPKGMEQVVGVIQSLCTIAQGVNTIIQAISVPSETANTLSLDALTTAVTANTIALYANSAVPFSKGGIAFEKGGVLHAATGVIAGQSYAGDKIPVAINSGEMVINQADQRKLFDAIHGDQIGMALGGMKLVLKGEDIYLAQKNYRKGVGL
jgi:hypothetical protein